MKPTKKNEKKEEDATITEVGRELLKYLHRRVEEVGINQASYRQARMEMLKTFDGGVGARFNWGFETVFTKEVHSLENMGLINVKYGSGAIMAGKGKPNQIYNVSLTSDGKDTAKVIVDRERKSQAETAKLKQRDVAAVVEDEVDTDRIEKEDVETRAVEALDPETPPPTGTPSARFARDDG